MTLVFSARDRSTEVHSAPLDADQLAARIDAAGMSGVATVLLQAFRPLAWMGGQVAWMLQPFMDGTGADRRSSLSMSGLASLLESERGVDDLLASLGRQKPSAEREP
jgi:hypothetical protein